MLTIHVQGRLTEDGKLEYSLPDSLPDEDFELVIQVTHASIQDDTEAKIQFEGKRIGEIALGQGADTWEHIGDSELWVAEQRRKQWEARKRQWTDS